MTTYRMTDLESRLLSRLRALSPRSATFQALRRAVGLGAPRGKVYAALGRLVKKDLIDTKRLNNADRGDRVWFAVATSDFVPGETKHMGKYGDKDFPMVANFGDGSDFFPEVGKYYDLENGDRKLGTFTFIKATYDDHNKCDKCALASESLAPCGQVRCAGRDGMLYGCYAVDASAIQDESNDDPKSEALAQIDAAEDFNALEVANSYARRFCDCEHDLDAKHEVDDRYFARMRVLLETLEPKVAELIAQTTTQAELDKVGRDWLMQFPTSSAKNRLNNASRAQLAVINDRIKAGSASDQLKADSADLELEIEAEIDAANDVDELNRLLNTRVKQVFSAGSIARLTERIRKRIEEKSNVQEKAPSRARKSKSKSKKEEAPTLGDFLERFRNAQTLDELHEAFADYRKNEERFSETLRTAAKEAAEECEANLRLDELFARIEDATSQADLNAIAADAENVEGGSQTKKGSVRKRLEERRAELDRANVPTPAPEDLETTIKRVVEETLARVLSASTSGVVQAPVQEPTPDPDVEELDAQRAELDELTSRVASIKRRIKTLESNILKRARAAARPVPLLELAEES